jgi:hypothetical protein
VATSMRLLLISWSLGSLTALLGCTASPQAVPKISTGATGCPEQQLVVFNYSRPNRTWNAACGEKQFVCSARGGIRCTKQEPETVDVELVTRAKALLEVPVAQRTWFVDKDISQGSWDSFATVVATVKALTPEQLERIDPRRVFAGGSATLDESMRVCGPVESIEVRVEADGDLTSPAWCTERLLSSPELAPFKREPFKTFLLVSGVFGLKPVARPALSGEAEPKTPSVAAGEHPVDAAATPQSQPAPESVAAAASPELDAAVRQWLDRERGAILTCVGKEQAALLVQVNHESKAEISIRGLPAGAPEEGCVRSALAKAPALPPGPATVLHLLRAVE